MNTRIKTWYSRIDTLTTQYQAVCEGLNTQQLNTKPDSQSWSIGQVLDHCIKINESYYPIASALKEGRYSLPFIARFKWITNLFGKFILDSVSPTKIKKINTFPIWEPSNTDLPADIAHRFARHHQEFQSFLQKNEALLNEEIIISSPANRIIVYSFAQAIEIILAHEERHLIQAKNIRTRIVESR